MKFKKPKLGRYFFEFVSMFLAVISAFALNNWNDNRRDALAEEKVLTEINNGLKLDLIDFAANKRGHVKGMSNVKFFENILNDIPIEQDSIFLKYYLLTGDNLSIISVTGYESLKSKGLELIKNDSIREQIITLYENDYQFLKKFEEDAPMNQVFANYFFPINNILAEYFIYDEDGLLSGIKTPLNLSLKETNLLKSYFFNIRVGRNNKLYEYKRIEKKVIKLRKAIEKELNNS